MILAFERSSNVNHLYSRVFSLVSEGKKSFRVGASAKRAKRDSGKSMKDTVVQISYEGR